VVTAFDVLAHSRRLFFQGVTGPFAECTHSVNALLLCAMKIANFLILSWESTLVYVQRSRGTIPCALSVSLMPYRHALW
jgi:hypothetical protein